MFNSQSPPLPSAATPMTPSTFFHDFLTKSSKSKTPAYAYSMLAVILALLAWNIRWRLNLSPRYPSDRNGTLVVALMLLFNHLAFQFRWTLLMTATLRILALAWIVFGFFYLFYWSHVLYPAA